MQKIAILEAFGVVEEERRAGAWGMGSQIAGRRHGGRCEAWDRRRQAGGFFRVSRGMDGIGAVFRRVSVLTGCTEFEGR